MRFNLLRRSSKILLSATTYLFDSLLFSLLLAMPRRSPDRLALVVRLDRIGDFVLWLPSAHRLCADWRARGLRVIGVVTAEFANFAEACGLFDEVLPVDRDRLRLDPFYRLRILTRIYRYGATEAVQPVWSRELSVGDAIIRFSRAQSRIGWSGDLKNITRLGRLFGNRFYSALLSAPDELMPEIVRNEDFAARLVSAPERTDFPGVPLANLACFDLQERYILLVPGANFSGRRWPARRFAEVAAPLYRDHGLSVVICGTARDRGLAERIKEQADVPIIDLTGRTDLRELAALIKAARLVISNDTASIHLAALVGTPSVCIMGGGHYGRFVSYDISLPRLYTPPSVVVHPMPCFQCNWDCKFPREEEGATRCIAAIEIKDVLDASRAALAEGRV